MNQIPVQEYNLPPAEPVKVKHHPIPYEGRLRAAALRVPAVIRQCTGIFVFGKRIKSLVFTTDMPSSEMWMPMPSLPSTPLPRNPPSQTPSWRQRISLCSLALAAVPPWASG